MLCRDKCTTRRCVKLFLVLINISFMVCGLLIIFVGDRQRMSNNHRYVTQLLTATPQVTSTTSSSCDSMTSSLSDHVTAIFSSAEALIATGSCVMILGFVGCCGACAENVWILGCYSVLTAIIVVPELLIIFIRRAMPDGLLKKLQHQVSCQYNVTAGQTDNIDQLTVDWNSMQAELKCCGASGPSDYSHSVWFNNTNNSSVSFVPSSCCMSSLHEQLRHDVYYNYEDDCQIEALVYFLNPDEQKYLSSLNTKGCHGLLMSSIRSGYGQTAIHVLCTVVLLQIIGFTSTCFLIHWIRKKGAI